MSEADNQAQIMLRLGSHPDVRLFRNHVGSGFTGQFVRTVDDLTILRNARRATFGLTPGSADLVGWRRLVITPEHVGQALAVFLSVECKSAAGKLRPDQQQWRAVVANMGGLAGMARTPDDAFKIAGIA